MHGIDVVDHLRSLLPYCIFFIFPVLILISPINPIEAAHDFTVYRLQQFDATGSKMGSRSAVVSFEARTLGARSLTRKCLILRLMEATGAVIRGAISQNVGGILILLPEKWTESSREHFLRLERELTSDEYLPGVVFARDSSDLSAIYAEVMRSVQADVGISAAAAGFQAVLSTGYQLEMTQLPPPGQTKGGTSGVGGRPMNDHEVVCLHGKLAGSGVEESLPTIILVAHYDAFGAAPGLSHGADSNGSGALALLELARLFSRLYSTSRTHARYNLVFLLSGAGKFNYYGTKKWLDDHLEGAETGLLSDVALIVNLEGLSGGPTLHMHVSKPPKEGSPGALFLNHLEKITESFPGRRVAMVHKKINLADETLAWEHERFSIRRLPGLTVTHFDNHERQERRTMLDREISIEDVSVNTQIVGEALVRLLYNISGFEAGQLVLDKWMSQELLVSLWKSTLSRFPLAAQMLHRKHPVLMTLQGILEQHLQEVRINAYKPDKRDPEIMFYDGFIYKMTAHNVKSTIFDFVLCCFICCYLAALYFSMQHLPLMLNSLSSILMPNGMKKLKAL